MTASEPHQASDSNDPDDDAIQRSTAEPFDRILQKRLDRRSLLATAGTISAALGFTGLAGGAPAITADHDMGPSTLSFKDLDHAPKAQYGISVAEGYNAQVLIRWGDPVESGAAAFDPANVTADRQLLQFGYNNDFIGYLPLAEGDEGERRGLLCINHEYTNRNVMTPTRLPDDQLTALEMAAHGHTVIEVQKTAEQWSVVAGSKFNRRISALKTDCKLSGPAAGHVRLQTDADPSGTLVRGTINNCAGGKTPWGTVLIAEENFNLYFGETKTTGPEARSHGRYGIGHKTRYAHWAREDQRFDPAQQPNECNRFGWMVEVNPFDPAAMPIKRTGLGRFKHEGASVVVNPDGRVVVYSADDQYFEYVYRFVSNGTFDVNRGAANGALLDDGVLSVAKYEADGTVRWMPLRHGDEPISKRFGFHSQADVLIDTRLAADRVGATPMDRPEEVAVNPATGEVFLALTKNKHRTAQTIDTANPRIDNRAGHIVKMIPPETSAGKDHTADTFRWDIFLLAGDPAAVGSGAVYHNQTSPSGWFATPDNVAFDPLGRIWVATDGAPKFGISDGLWAMDTQGAGAALSKHFFNTPVGAELCGPEFTPQATTLFVAVQHPGERSSYDAPSTRWPAEPSSALPPRPSVVAITKKDGGMIGTS